MNILFLGKKKRNDYSGIEKKMSGQIDAFRALGHQVWFLYTELNSIYLERPDGEIEKILNYSENMFSIYWAYEKAARKVVMRFAPNIDMCYIRKPLCTIMHLKTLESMRRGGWKIIEEIPTFPYDDELKVEKGIKSKVYLWIDRCGRGFLKKNVDFFSTYSKHEKIFGRKTIQLENGIDIKEIKKRKMNFPQDIHLLTVSTMCPWHGYDRLIRGLANYYQKECKRKVYVDMVGDGSCLQIWKKLSMELGIENYVVFHGSLRGEQLERMFNCCQIAISSLGLHRIGLHSSSVLKNREYVTRGIPIVYANEDQCLKQIDQYCYKVNDDESDVNIMDIVKFIDSLNDYEQIADNMRDYAEENLSWEIQMNKVISACIQ